MSVKLIHVSDTHLKEFNPQAGDILIHSGDALSSGKLAELDKFRGQLEAIKHNYKHIIFVPGNHDWIFSWNYEQACNHLKATIDNLHILHNSSIELEGLKFYGTADQPVFFDWAFNLESPALMESYAKIPNDTQVLITHCPPKYILDHVFNRWHPHGEHVGSDELSRELPRLKQLKAHLFGHIHSGRGQKLQEGIEYSNASICDEQYQPTNQENVIEL